MSHIASLDLPPTRKIFHAAPYQRLAEARVQYVADDAVVLDQSIFYAESGGQMSDRGTVAGHPLRDVQKYGGSTKTVERRGTEAVVVRSGSYIVHYLDTAPTFRVGQLVALELDWPYRYALMRYHSAAHFVYHVVQQILQEEHGEALETRGCAIREEGFRFDFGNRLPSHWMPELERRYNAAIATPSAIRMEAVASHDDVFYWHCRDIVIPCGGTHVRETTELAPLCLRRRSKGARALRIQGGFIDTTD